MDEEIVSKRLTRTAMSKSDGTVPTTVPLIPFIGFARLAGKTLPGSPSVYRMGKKWRRVRGAALRGADKLRLT
jgi:hypothetical protein